MMMDQLSFIQRLAWYSLGMVRSTDLKDIAWVGIEEGYESPSLLMLAGLERNADEFHYYYELALKELDLVLDKEQAALILTRSIIDKVLNKDLDPFEACKTIFWEILELAGLSYLGKHFSYDGLGLNQVYGSYLYIDDLLGYSTDVKRLNELKQEARINMKKWLDLHA